MCLLGFYIFTLNIESYLVHFFILFIPYILIHPRTFMIFQVYKHELYGPRYVHIVFHSDGFENWKWYTRSLTNCTEEQEELVIRNFVFMNRAGEPVHENTQTSAGYVSIPWNFFLFIFLRFFFFISKYFDFILRSSPV